MKDLKDHNFKLKKMMKLSNDLNIIHYKLDNFDNLKASKISDMPMSKSDIHDKVGEIVVKREELVYDKIKKNMELLRLKQHIDNINLTLDCMKYVHKYVLCKKYKENKPNRMILKDYNKDVGILNYQSLCNLICEAINIYNKISK